MIARKLSTHAVAQESSSLAAIFTFDSSDFCVGKECSLPFKGRVGVGIGFGGA
ncbi:MAG: hypothetical protein K0S28_506 [Paucimonas sp.]|nr:hypothetical protein [Paucimonas sp.]